MIYNSLLFGESEGHLTWQVWQRGYEKFLQRITYGNANECSECPEELPEGDDEGNYKGIYEIHLGDGVTEGNEINALKEFLLKKCLGRDRKMG